MRCSCQISTAYDAHNDMADETPQDETATEQQTDPPRKLPLTETLILATLSAVIYVLAFLYEQGFLSYFGIPTQFITVSLVTLLIFGAGTITFLYISVGLANIVYTLLPKHRYLAFYIPRYLLLGFLTIVVPLFLFRGERLYLIMLCVWLILVIGLLVHPLIKYRKEGDWNKRYDAAIKALPDEPVSTLYTLIEKRYGMREVGYWVYVFIILFALAANVGKAEATTQAEFLVLNTVPEVVVLRVSGENLICAPFDRQAHEVKKSFSIRKIAEDTNLVMSLESVGPLKPVEKFTSESVAPTPTPNPIPSPSPITTPEPTPQATREPIVN
jgi:hypothetical protein